MRRKYELVLTRCNRLDTFYPPRRWRHRLAGVLLLVLGQGGAAWAQTSGDLDEFYRSVTDGRAEIVREGLRENPDWANAELFLGIRPVYRASVLGREEIVGLLLEAGADVNARTDRGTHALHAAAQHGYDPILHRLLAAGADVNPRNDEGQTPLFLAIRNGHEESAEALLARGAEVNVVDIHGRTPLHYAAGLGRLKTVSLLLGNGAELNGVDKEGYSPLGLCRAWKRNQFEQVGPALVAAGAVDVQPPPRPAREGSPAEPGANAPEGSLDGRSPERTGRPEAPEPVLPRDEESRS